MIQRTTTADTDMRMSPLGVDIDGGASAVSWPAVFAGAAAAASLSLILLVLGAGLGFSAVSPWAEKGVSGTTLGVSAILWLAFVQLAASGIGGYLAGRLRTRWSGVHTDEVYFRDTAHGLLAWSVATLATAALLTSAVGAAIGTSARAGAAMASGVATTGAAAAAMGTPAAVSGAASSAAGARDPAGYFVDALLRRDGNQAASAPAGGGQTDLSPSPNTGEVGAILANAVASGGLPAEDTRYLGSLVAQRSGLSQADAEKRVTDTFQRLQARTQALETSAREAADKARKASAYASLWMFVALLLGAFVASLAATWGGRQRDR